MTTDTYHRRAAVAASRAASAMRRAAEGAHLPPMPHGVRAWVTRAISKRQPSAHRVRVRVEAAPVLDLLPEAARADAERYLGYVLGEGPEPRRYLQPGEVAVRASDLEEWAAAAMDAAGELAELQAGRRELAGYSNGRPVWTRGPHA